MSDVERHQPSPLDPLPWRDGIPAACAVAGRDGAVRSEVFGVDVDACFQAASISKPVAAVTALSLVADGVLGLDDNVEPLLRSWQLPPLGGWQPVITLRHLLTHAAGLTVHGFPGHPRGEAVPTLVEVLDGRGNTPAVRPALPPGLIARYSGGGYVLVQLLLEDLTGRPFTDLAHQRVLAPAGMTTAGYGDPASPAPALRADGQPVAGGPHRYPEAAGGLWATPADLVRFAGAVQRRELLPAALHADLLTEQVPAWGLGVQLFEPGRFGHGGSNDGYRCRLLAATDGSWAAAVMTGSDAGGVVCLDVLNELADREGWEGWVPFPPVVDAREWIPRLRGVFEDERGRSWTLDGDASSGLWLRLPGQPPVAVEPTGYDESLIPAWDAALRLDHEADQLIGLELRMAGERFAARKAGPP